MRALFVEMNIGADVLESVLGRNTVRFWCKNQQQKFNKKMIFAIFSKIKKKCDFFHFFRKNVIF